MALLNPVYGLVVPFLLFFTMPFAIFAGFTTALAFMVLMFRVFIVYFEIALALVPEFLTRRIRYRHVPFEAPRPLQPSWTITRDHSLQLSIPPTSTVNSESEHGSPARSPLRSGYTTPGTLHPRHRQQATHAFSMLPKSHRRSHSHASAGSAGTITPMHEGEVLLATEAALTPSVGLDRDFEGIGGWRLDGNEDEDGSWTNINSRLELPGDRMSISAHHRSRSRSLGPLTPAEGPLLLSSGFGVGTGAQSPVERQASPSSSRRTTRAMRQLPSAPAAVDTDNGYFPKVLSPVAKSGSSQQNGSR
ncbi:hypothetical protein B0T18DRAFT_59804 [Schizothecium vesticola]|uniref:Uncharacterized protein n=1 Tax=Schizothecium vesticola TaxID=314040 RepID=A0AA40K9E8_9PEZI|nr:hypothetical protein B0T18DRAFT_59804 [Schizothecium vesticola]